MGEPIPPADSIPDAVLALNSIISALRSDSALEALEKGDATSIVDARLWGPAWEGARTFRPAFLLGLARATRNKLIEDVAAIGNSGVESVKELRAHAIEARLRIVLDFGFRFLQPIHLATLADALMLAVPGSETGLSKDELTRELIGSAMKSPYATERLCTAVILGSTEMHILQARAPPCAPKRLN